MKVMSIANIVLGIGLVVLGVVGLLDGGGGAGPVIPILIGVSLTWLGFRGGRRGSVIFGHGCIVTGCYLVAWGVHLAQVVGSAPTWLQILTQPLFWGLFSIFGGICANFHAFCGCVQRMAMEKKAACCGS
jgi:hypothetical protein